jgi:NAD(P)H-flavin reductase
MIAAPQPTPIASPWLPRVATIESIVPETPGVATYRLRFTGSGRSEEYAFLPGQFNMLYLPGFGEVAISLSGPPPSAVESQPPALVHTIREAGNVTTALRQLGVGGSVAVRGPYGKPWPVEQCLGKDVVLVAGGLGMAPLRPVIYHLLAHCQDYGRVVLLCGARSPENLLFAAEFSAWQARRLEIQTTVDRAGLGWQGNVGVVPLLVDRLTPLDPDNTVLLTCGPEVMMRFVAKSALARRMPPERIWLSLERHMQCAIGLCGHCQLGTELICRDGPTFAWDRIEPMLQIHDL